MTYVQARLGEDAPDTSLCQHAGFGGQFGGEGGSFVQQLAPLKAVTELPEYAIEQVPKGGRMPVTVLVATSATVGFGSG
ncbi:hypothetical protein [Streptomyces sp. NPDC050564]|uniref:hypothetical protein n=1 Tax=Streptomyces sp. NPDC050564 TaxID=3365631 RepID=UPI0037B22B37